MRVVNFRYLTMPLVAVLCLFGLLLSIYSFGREKLWLLISAEEGCNILATCLGTLHILCHHLVGHF